MANELKLTLTDLDGAVLDDVELSRDELEQAQHSGMHAKALLGELSAGRRED